MKTHITIAGLGASHGTITLDALNFAYSADVILVPRSCADIPSLAENIILPFVREKPIIPLTFPMTNDALTRDEALRSQLEGLKSELDGKNIFFPTIGDSMLYSTSKYLIDALHSLNINLTVDFMPGISAHSIAASAARNFLAMSDEIFTVIPGTAPCDKISSALAVSQAAAIYKPSAISNIRSVIDPSQWRKIIRVDHAGTEREIIYEGLDAIFDGGDYMSVILLHR